MLLAVLLFAAQPAPDEGAAPALPAANPTSAEAQSHGRAAVRIVRAFRLESGENGAVEGAQRRSATISGPDGAGQLAQLVEFE